MSKEPKIIGWAEYIDFPQWGVFGVKTKVDTGARSSALHVEDLEHLPHGRVRFDVIYSRMAPYRRKTVEARALKWSRVRSSTGEYTERCFVRTTIRIGEVERVIELSLVSRENMLFRMLLGRKALEKQFLVDVNHRNLLSSRPRKKSATKKVPKRTK